MNADLPLTAESIADLPQAPDDGTHEIAPDLAYRRLAMVNVVFYGAHHAGDRQWVLIDAGIIGATSLIESAAEERFGKGARPAAIILTHGHFDHIGGLKSLSEKWEAPIYAHEMELPYLNGTASYPPPDPTVGGGIMPLLAPLFPRGPIEVRERLHVLPSDGTVPGMPGWRWLHTPGHSAGHISLWREADRALIGGDAFVTTRQESAYAVALQKPELHGPPTYFTPDWPAAERSVQSLANLQSELVVCGHGKAMRGEEMQRALQILARNFNTLAVPPGGKYVAHPATAGDGSAYRSA